uniref:Uncharacterized protein n=1 Tax=Glossina austeni TaxID=7395 RepID=A0A1A9VHL7_GLOAU
MYLHTAVHSIAHKAFHAKLCTTKKLSLSYNLDQDGNLRLIQFTNIVPSIYNASFIYVLAICKERIPDASRKKVHRNFMCVASPDYNCIRMSVLVDLLLLVAFKEQCVRIAHKLIQDFIIQNYER